MSCIPPLQPRSRRIQEWPEENDWPCLGGVGMRVVWPLYTALISHLRHNKIKWDLRLVHCANLCQQKAFLKYWGYFSDRPGGFFVLFCFLWQITVMPRHGSKWVTCHNFKIHHCNIFALPTHWFYHISLAFFCFSLSFVVLGIKLRALNSTNELQS